MELEALNKALPKFTAEGASILAISPQRMPYNRQVVRKSKLDFEILSDAGNNVSHLFGIKFNVTEELKQVMQSFNVDLKRLNGDNSWTLPMPGRFLIDQSGIIRAADVDPDYTIRTEPEDTLNALRALSAK